VYTHVSKCENNKIKGGKKKLTYKYLADMFYCVDQMRLSFALRKYALKRVKYKLTKLSIIVHIPFIFTIQRLDWQIRALLAEKD
jgi:hypothetical protein